MNELIPSPTIHDRIEQLTPRLRGWLFNKDNRSLSIDDLFQEAVIHIYRKAEKDPTFVLQKDAYIIQYGVWMAKNHAQTEHTYSTYVGRFNDLPVTSDDAEDEITAYEVFPVSDPDPAAEVERREALAEMVQAVRRLSPENRVIVKMLYAGYAESEIADHLHISRPAISQRKVTIAKALHRQAII